jgi:allophanate hydrolase
VGIERGIVTSAVAAVEDAFAGIAADGRSGIWIALADRDVALQRAADIDTARERGTNLPLAGLTLAVKDNIDVAGLPTTAGCPAYAYDPALDAPVVAALTAAGAVVIGKTSLDQFATGLVGVRSPHGACPNARWPGLVSGGSSSGSAVAVATGVVDIALGTDTAGSGRVPAACNGIVGLKPTRGRTSTRGVVPACRSLDCVSVFAGDVATAALATALIAGHDPQDPWSRAAPSPPAVLDRPLRVGVPDARALTFDGDPDGAARFGTAVEALRDVATVGVDLDPFIAVGDLLYGGSFVAERYEAVGPFVDAHPDDVDPVVRSIIAASAAVPAWQVFRDRTELVRLAALTSPTWDTVDVLVVPSVPRVPTIAEVLAAPIAVNSMLGTYTNFVNLLDLCALTVPVGPPTAAGPPASITLIGPAWSEDVLVGLAASLGTPASPPGA